MSPTDHEHTFVRDGQELLPCACGANVLAIQDMLHPAADDARRLAGDPYYTGCRLRQELEAVELWLFNAPWQVVQELEATYPGVYLIHNDAPRPLTALDELRDSFDWHEIARWRETGEVAYERDFEVRLTLDHERIVKVVVMPGGVPS